MDLHTFLVFDLGPTCLRLGLSGDEEPKTVVRTPSAFRDFFIDPKLNGAAAIHEAVTLALEDLASQKTQSFPNGLSLEGRSVFFSHPQDASKSYLKQLCDYFWSKHVQYCAFMSKNPLALYSFGRVSGLLVHIGDQSTSVAAIYEGHITSTRCSPLAMHTVQRCLAKLLADNGQNPSEEQLTTLKETICYLATRFETEYQSEDCGRMMVDKPLDSELLAFLSYPPRETFVAPEVLFKPSLLELDEDGLHYVIHDTINAAPLDTRKDMLGNILLCGGGARLPGIKERLELEIRSLQFPQGSYAVDAGVRCTVVNPKPSEQPELFPWVGGSILTSLSTFERLLSRRDSQFSHNPFAKTQA
eukprot:TRINITY_DN1088_c0_g1_i2.p1 TRINITY_DN1088_c0_g1~~TRINITY_DN1088_c0_g1_i2.p1  ORF type:complete len:382 (-),score=46.44 TRINITY_DN1088_c0_g1_i2:170-1243(-)